MLCRSCNGGEGKVKNTAIRYGGGSKRWRKWLQDMLGYLAMHSTPKSTYLHPEHKTDNEKRLARNAKARRKRAKK